ncbi:uncharacterized protein LOC133525326 [Cydia pomonella]|uniref:uncharacterized protein LOC133525326 n=1 Tax=Cydia pomonella TaxID=82600 RepID=UPI002ADE5F68|nr:uncharacterized protein LOC133525326 [Cydia pomonella]
MAILMQTISHPRGVATINRTLRKGIKMRTISLALIQGQFLDPPFETDSQGTISKELEEDVKETLVNHVDIVLTRLESLGWIVNYEKSVLKPQTGLVYLGVYWDPWSNQKYLPKDKLPKSFEKGICDTSRCEGRSSVVDAQLSLLVSNSCATSVSFSDNRRIRSCVGSATRLSVSLGSLDECGKRVALQSKGDACHSKRFGRSLSAPVSLDGPSSERQQDYYSLPPQPGRNEVDTSLTANVQSFPIAGTISDPSKPVLLTREVQQSRGSSIKIARTSGMASSSRRHGASIFQVGSASNRPVCFGESSCRNQLCIDRPKRPRSPVSRCLFKGLEFRTGMDFSTPVFDTESADSPEPSFRNIPIDSSSMAPCLLACGSQSSCHSSSLYTRSPRQDPSGRDHKSTAFECPRNDARSLEVWGWSESLTGWNSAQIALLQSSWRASTRKTYNTAWKKWVTWSTQHKVNTTQPSGPEVAKYLSDLYLVDKLSYKTILLYKSVVSTLCNTDSAERLSTHVLVKHVLKSIALRNPIDKKPPIWNVEVLIDYLRKSKINHDNIFEACRRTALLLLLCTGRRIHDLTLLNIDCNHCIFTDNSIIFWPIFGSKTDCADYRQSGWKLLTNETCKNLDPVFWIQQTFSLLKSRRESANCNSLFISLRGDVKAASRALIAGWVKSVFREAGITATPGSIRAAVASKNWVDNCSVEDILSRDAASDQILSPVALFSLVDVSPSYSVSGLRSDERAVPRGLLSARFKIVTNVCCCTHERAAPRGTARTTVYRAQVLVPRGAARDTNYSPASTCSDDPRGLRRNQSNQNYDNLYVKHFEDKELASKFKGQLMPREL